MKDGIRSAVSRIYFSGVHRVFPSNEPNILMYHSIEPGEILPVSVKKFRSQLAWFLSHYSIVDLPVTIESDDPHNVALTFDDATTDFTSVVLPILREFHVPATLFVVSGSLNGDPLSAPTLSEDDLLDLVNEPLVTIGNHTQTHPTLTRLDPDEQREEIVGGKRDLERALGVEVDRFAYPGGQYDDSAVDIVRESHSYGVTSDSPVRYTYSPVTLPRIACHNATSQIRWELSPFARLYNR